MGLIALVIKAEDPGTVLFTQKRIGQNKQYFELHKFRSMKMDASHDIPTHMLNNPEQYLTKTGRFLRKYSLDELPQLWDIFYWKYECGRTSAGFVESGCADIRKR